MTQNLGHRTNRSQNLPNTSRPRLSAISPTRQHIYRCQKNTANPHASADGPHRLASPLWTSPYAGKRKRSRRKETKAFYASRLFFPDGNSVKQPAVRQGSLCGSQASTVSFRPFPLSVTHHRRICADKNKACKNAHTQRGGTGGCAPSSGSAKKSGKKPIALPEPFYIAP